MRGMLHTMLPAPSTTFLTVSTTPPVKFETCSPMVWIPSASVASVSLAKLAMPPWIALLTFWKTWLMTSPVWLLLIASRTFVTPLATSPAMLMPPLTVVTTSVSVATVAVAGRSTGFTSFAALLNSWISFCISNMPSLSRTRPKQSTTVAKINASVAKIRMPICDEIDPLIFASCFASFLLFPFPMADSPPLLLPLAPPPWRWCTPAGLSTTVTSVACSSSSSRTIAPTAAATHCDAASTKERKKNQKKKK
mmetsp:Transcript_2607/g.6206  ORF Transcript_2607/g.6206 Transcript_2607/m.6206 type:complete len:251 (+) Transcript_2607:432-1184(+)